MSRMRLQVDDEYGTASVIVDEPELTRGQRRQLEGLVDELLAGLPERDRWLMVALLTRQVADERAYERVCQQRGLLC